MNVVRMMIAALLVLSAMAASAQDKPDILVIWGDDVFLEWAASVQDGAEVPLFGQERAYTSPIWYTPQ